MVNQYLSLRRLYLALLVCVVALLLFHFFPEDLNWTIHNRFDLDGEANIPAWFATVLLFSVSFSSLILFLLSVQSTGDQRPVFFWLIFGLAYMFLSLDEAARIHEIFDEVFRIKWIFVYAPFGFAFFAFCSFWLIKRNESKSLRYLVLVGMCVFGTGGLLGESVAHFFWTQMTPSMRTAELLFEEGLELVGTSTVLIGVLSEFSHRYRIVKK